MFACLRRITFKLGKFTYIKALFLVMSNDFPQLVFAKIEKTVQGSIVMISVKFAVGARWPGLYLEVRLWFSFLLSYYITKLY